MLLLWVLIVVRCIQGYWFSVMNFERRTAWHGALNAESAAKFPSWESVLTGKPIVDGAILDHYLHQKEGIVL